MNFSIVIPTYNRPEKLLTVLQKLMPQIDESIEVLIIDNCSDIILSDFVLGKIDTLNTGSLRFIRNTGNVGLGGNILMAFLQCKSEWMWLLGDDDVPLFNAIETIKRNLKEIANDIFALKFNSYAGGFPAVSENFKTINKENSVAYLSNHSYYSNFLFISNSVYRTNDFKKYTFQMSNGLRTIAPHIIVSLNLLCTDKKVSLIDEYLVNHGRVVEGESNWSPSRLISGVVDIYNSDIPKYYKNNFIPVLLNNYVSAGEFSAKSYFSFALKNFDINESRNFLFKCAAIHKSYKSLQLIFFGYLVGNIFVNRLLSGIYKSKEGLKDNIDLLRN